MQITKYCSNSSIKALDIMLDNVCCKENANFKQVFVVPNGCLDEVKNYIISRVVKTASFKVDVCSFAELANYFFVDTSYTKICKLDGQFFIKEILTKNEKQLKCFGATRKTLTFSGLIYDVILEFKKNGVKAEELKNDCLKTNGGRGKEKLIDLCFIYQKYEEFLKQNNYIDGIDEYTLAANNVSKKADIKNQAFNFCCFDEFADCELNLVESVAKYSNGVGISMAIPRDKQPNAEIYSSNFETNINKIAKNLSINCEKKCDFTFEGETKQQICENLFALSNGVMPKEAKGKVVLLNSLNISSEVLYTAKRINWLIKNGVCRFKDIAVAVTDLNLYAPFINQQFEKNDLSFWINQQTPLENTPCFKLVADAILCFRNHFLQSDVLSIVYNPAFGLSKESRQFVETITSKYGIDGDLWTKELKNERGGELFKQFEEIKKQIVFPILVFSDNIEKSKTLNDYCTSVIKFLSDVNAKENLQKCMGLYGEEKYILQQSYEKIEKELLKACENIGDKEIEFADFMTVFFNVIGKKNISKLARSLDSVFVGSVEQVKFLKTKYLFLLGANENALPEQKSDVGIVSDADIRELQSLSNMRTITQQNALKKFDVLQSFLAGDELCVSYPNKDLSDSLMPSSLIDTLQNLFSFNNQKLPVARVEELMEDDNVFGSVEDRIAFNLSSINNALNYVSESDLTNVAFDVIVNIFKDNGIDVRNLLEDFEIDDYIQQARELFFSRGTTKVTQLETYFSCPFKHFATYGIGLFEKEESKVKENEIGNILHAVSEIFIKEHCNKTLKNEEILQISYKIFAKVISKPEFEHLLLDKKNKTILDELKVESGKVCKALYYQNSHSKFEPKYCEAVFGDESFAKKAQFNVDGVKLELNGKVDRVDMFENYVRVVDYKTGKTSSKFNKGDLFDGKKIQLYVYMWAILNGMKQKDLQPAGVFLMPLHNEWADKKAVSIFEKYKLDGTTLADERVLRAQDDQVCLKHPKSDIVNFAIKANKDIVDEFIPSGSNLVSAAGFNNMLNYSIKITEKAIAEILSGYIEAKPHVGTCTYCNCKSFCKFFRHTLQYVRADKFTIDEKSFEGEENAKDTATTSGN